MLNSEEFLCNPDIFGNYANTNTLASVENWVDILHIYCFPVIPWRYSESHLKGVPQFTNNAFHIIKSVIAIESGVFMAV